MQCDPRLYSIQLGFVLSFRTVDVSNSLCVPVCFSDAVLVVRGVLADVRGYIAINLHSPPKYRLALLETALLMGERGVVL